MPAKRRASRFDQASRQLVCGAEACSENEHLLGVVSGFQPGPGAVNPGKAADRGDGGSCHAGRLARVDRALGRPFSVKTRMIIGATRRTALVGEPLNLRREEDQPLKMNRCIVKHAGAEERSRCTLPSRIALASCRSSLTVRSGNSPPLHFIPRCFWPPQPQRSPDPGSSPPKANSSRDTLLLLPRWEIAQRVLDFGLEFFRSAWNTTQQRVDHHHNNWTIKLC